MDRYGTLRLGLVGAWCPSLRTGGYTLEDRSNVRYNGTILNAPTWSAGALSLTAASSQYVPVWDAANVNKWTGGAMAVTAWIRPTSVSGTQAVVSSLDVGGGGATFAVEIGRTSGKITIIHDGSIAATSAATISAGQWSFVAMSRLYDGSNWQIRLAINNVLESYSTATAPRANAVGTLAIGRHGAFAGFYFGGLIDDVRIWNRPLADSEFHILRTGRGVGLLPARHRRANVLGSQFWLRDSGTWKKATGWIKVNGVWTKATPKLNVSGTWK